MKIISTHDAAKRLGIHFTTLAQHIAKSKLPAPTVMQVGSRTIHAWTEEQIENARKLLPKIKNGRKTRYRKREQAIDPRPQEKTRKKKQKKKEPEVRSQKSGETEAKAKTKKNSKKK